MYHDFVVLRDFACFYKRFWCVGHGGARTRSGKHFIVVYARFKTCVQGVLTKELLVLYMYMYMYVDS